jgi:hypothetical protein
MGAEEWFGIMASRIDSMDEVQAALATEVQRIAKKQTSHQQSVSGGSPTAGSSSSKSSAALTPALVNLAEGIKNKEVSSFIESVLEREWLIDLDQVELLHEVI